ncbi:MAG TPA: hypothetical protein VK453_18805 [Micromonosporaceae bacterium]|nr:hypothetical protein [Micromonosporaceae bacterium]
MIRPDSAEAATRAGARVALVTCAELAGLDPDDRHLLDPLGERGLAVAPAIWDDPSVDWSGYALVVLRSPWDYTSRREEFLAWADKVPRLRNPAAVLRWNTDKRYLTELAGAGVPVVPTDWFAPGHRWDPGADGEVVIKPTVSAGSRDSGRYDLADTAARTLARAHLDRLHAAGRVAMVQPYVPSVDSAGETALIYLGGRYSHAIRKGPILDGPDFGPDGSLYRTEDITPREPTAAERAAADRVLAALPFPAADLLYARVDLVPGSGEPLLMELELTEPSLFFRTAAGSAERFADVILASVG